MCPSSSSSSSSSSLKREEEEEVNWCRFTLHPFCPFDHASFHPVLIVTNCHFGTHRPFSTMAASTPSHPNCMKWDQRLTTASWNHYTKRSRNLQDLTKSEGTHRNPNRIHRRATGWAPSKNTGQSWPEWHRNGNESVKVHQSQTPENDRNCFKMEAILKPIPIESSKNLEASRTEGWLNEKIKNI